MKTFLRYFATALVALSFAGLAGSLITRALIKRNRDSRNEFHVSVVEPTERKEREDYLMQRVALEAEAAKKPGAIALLPVPNMAASTRAITMEEAFDRPFHLLTELKIDADSITIGSLLLLLYCYSALSAIRAKERRSNQPPDPTPLRGAGHL